MFLLLKDVRAQKFPRTDFFKTLTADRIGGHRTRFEDKVYQRP